MPAVDVPLRLSALRLAVQDGLYEHVRTSSDDVVEYEESAIDVDGRINVDRRLWRGGKLRDQRGLHGTRYLAAQHCCVAGGELVSHTVVGHSRNVDNEKIVRVRQPTWAIEIHLVQPLVHDADQMHCQPIHLLQQRQSTVVRAPYAQGEEDEHDVVVGAVYFDETIRYNQQSGLTITHQYRSERCASHPGLASRIA